MRPLYFRPKAPLQASLRRPRQTLEAEMWCARLDLAALLPSKSNLESVRHKEPTEVRLTCPAQGIVRCWAPRRCFAPVLVRRGEPVGASNIQPDLETTEPTPARRTQQSREFCRSDSHERPTHLQT